MNIFVSVIEWLYGFTGDYIWAVLLFTIMIKLILLPLDIKSKNSMRRMQAVAPKTQAIRERYKNDPAKMNAALKELYKKENVSQMGGCLPVLIQIPILFLMFGAIRSLSYMKTVELVVNLSSDPTVLPHSFLWVHNIWQPDTGIADVMPSLSEFAASLSNASSALPQSVVATATDIVNMSAVHNFATAAQSIPQTTALGSVFSAAYATIPAETISLAAQTNYAAIINPVLVHFEGLRNGFFLFPLLAGVGQFFAAWYMNKRQAAAGQQTQGMGLQLLMPAMIVYFACTTGALFALYYAVSSLWSLGYNVIVDMIWKKKQQALAEV